jgi:hypothetical protein
MVEGLDDSLGDRRLHVVSIKPLFTPSLILILVSASVLVSAHVHVRVHASATHLATSTPARNTNNIRVHTPPIGSVPRRTPMARHHDVLGARDGERGRRACRCFGEGGRCRGSWSCSHGR